MRKVIAISSIVGVVIAMILMGTLLPIAFNDILGFTSTNSTVQTLMRTVLPVMVSVGFVVVAVGAIDD